MPPPAYTQRELLRRLLAMAWQHRAGCLLLIGQQAALVLLSLAGLGGIGLGEAFGVADEEGLENLKLRLFA